MSRVAAPYTHLQIVRNSDNEGAPQVDCLRRRRNGVGRSAEKWVRILFAGPGAIIVAVAVMAGMTRWVPRGAAGIDNLVLPLVLAPLIWAGLFFHACLDRSVARIAFIATGLLVVHGGLVAQAFLNNPAATEAAR